MADSPRSLEEFKGVREAQLKLDYFLLGLASALFAYLGGQYKPMPISFSQNTIELISLGLFFISIISSFKRLDFNISVMKLNFKKLDLGERKGEMQKALSIPGPVLNIETGENLNKHKAADIIQLINENKPKVEADIEKYTRYSSVSFTLRNWALILGFIALAFSKIVGVYAISASV